MILFKKERSLNLLVVVIRSNDVQLFGPTESLTAFTIVALNVPEPVTKQSDPIMNDFVGVRLLRETKDVFGKQFESIWIVSMEVKNNRKRSSVFAKQPLAILIVFSCGRLSSLKE